MPDDQATRRLTVAGNNDAVLITGASGFIGRHVATLLRANGYRVARLDHRPDPASDEGAYRCDLLEPDELRRVIGDASPSSVLHLAARTDLDGTTLADYAANVEGVANLVAAIRESGTVRRAICASTQLVCRIGYKPSHDADYQPSTVYGESKVRTEQIWRDADGGGTSWCLVRPTTIWGPYMNPHYLRFFRMIRDGRYVHVSGGPYRKSYGYVGNTSLQLQRLLEATVDQVQRRVFYLADYEPLVLEDWADAFRAAMAAPRIRTVPLAMARLIAGTGDQLVRFGWRGFPFTSFRLMNVRTSYVVDTTATREVCGELPYSMADGVAATAAWLRETWRTENGSSSSRTSTVGVERE